MIILKGDFHLPVCKIEIIDEVNVKISNLDLDTRKFLVKKFKYEDPTARYRPAYKLGRWDGTVSFFGLGGTTYLSMLPTVLEYLEERNYTIELEDKRNPISLSFDHINEEFWGDKVWPSGHQLEGKLIRLRDYQIDVINKFLENPQSIQSVSTGAGKTIITATLAKICEKYGRTITIVPNKSLVEQTEEDFINCDLDVGVYYGDRKDIGKTHTITTWQSLNILDKKAKDLPAEKLKLENFLSNVSAVIVDECHGVKADVLKNLLTNQLSHVFVRWGLTGTIPKDDISFTNLNVSLGEVVNKVSASNLQEQGVLSKCNVNILQFLEYREFNSYAEELKFLVTNQERLDYIAELIDQTSKSSNSLILVDRIETGKYLQLQIKDSVFISGQVKTKDRKSEYDEVKTAQNKVIIATYGVAAVGINIVRLHNLFMIEPGKSFIRVIQSIGRGLRKGHDKNHVEIYDITSTCKFSKKHLTERKKYYAEANYPYTIRKINYSST